MGPGFCGDALRRSSVARISATVAVPLDGLPTGTLGKLALKHPHELLRREDVYDRFARTLRREDAALDVDHVGLANVALDAPSLH
jgi:hypothetical protein